MVMTHEFVGTSNTEVTVVDVFHDVASVVVRSQPFVEYLHLARFGDQWLIVNPLYWVISES